MKRKGKKNFFFSLYAQQVQNFMNGIAFCLIYDYANQTWLEKSCQHCHRSRTKMTQNCRPRGRWIFRTFLMDRRQSMCQNIIMHGLSDWSLGVRASRWSWPQSTGDHGNVYYSSSQFVLMSSVEPTKHPRPNFTFTSHSIRLAMLTTAGWDPFWAATAFEHQAPFQTSPFLSFPLKGGLGVAAKSKRDTSHLLDQQVHAAAVFFDPIHLHHLLHNQKLEACIALIVIIVIRKPCEERSSAGNPDWSFLIAWILNHLWRVDHHLRRVEKYFPSPWWFQIYDDRGDFS